ncbi:MAG: FemAB family XrtA/PEP-CTERM system-associated protein [Euryarchaeota archaeon]|nr:FemAB family XrtA/PEP-CTERM system-associated protein [Euryarchaeota archaeon]
MEISELRTGEEDAWDSYVYESDESTFYHQIGWRDVVLKTYGHKPRYLVARGDDGGIVGVLPMFLMESRIFGRKLVSVPFAPYGGVCADDAGVGRALMEEGKRVAKEERVDYFEIRQFAMSDSGLVTNEAYVTSILTLDRNPEVVRGAFRKSMRRYIRKAAQHNFQVNMVSKDTKEFYGTYSQSMRKLGTPAHGPAFFRNMLLEFPEDINIATIEYDREVISTMLLLYFKNTAIYGWGASLNEYLKLSPNYLLFWDAIKDSCEKGFTFFDFGRSQPNTGVFLFKEGWGAESKQLYYQYYLHNAKSVPDTGQSNPIRQRFARIWCKLPALLTNKIGHVLRRNLP